ncbi:MAG: hypothetical protein Q7Q73_01920 [Verrucomicrobiota bacterium JB024]|nr:hypothetical protein [Verrucomicrobiota bacterium JB024]
MRASSYSILLLALSLLAGCGDYEAREMSGVQEAQLFTLSVAITIHDWDVLVAPPTYSPEALVSEVAGRYLQMEDKLWTLERLWVLKQDAPTKEIQAVTQIKVEDKVYWTLGRLNELGTPSATASPEPYPASYFRDLVEIPVEGWGRPAVQQSL